MVLSVLLMLTVFGVQANEKPLPPHKVVETTTEKLIKVILEAKKYADAEPERFYAELELLIDPLIDFPSFTRSVMGRYGSKKYYSQLNEEEKAIYRAQYRRFVATFRSGLIQTYAKGLLVFDGQKIEVVAPRPADLEDAAKGKAVDVVQHIYGSAEKPYEVIYKMRRDGDGSWKVRNVTIESINIGKVYRSQFENAMQQYQDDLAKVVDTWTVKAEDFKKHEANDAAG
jgi:phospholipid transport system substrate-binding protein